MDKTQLWGSAITEHSPDRTIAMDTIRQGDTHSSVYGLLLIISLLISFRYTRRHIAPIINGSFYFARAWKAKDDVSLEISKVILFLIGLLHLSFLSSLFIQAYRPDLFGLFNWLLTPTFMVAFFLLYALKWSALSFIGWLVKKPNELRFLAKSARDYVILAAILTLPFTLFNLFLYVQKSDYLLFCGGVLSLFSLLLFFLRSFHLFLHLRFSVFLWILYLCTLEIAPLMLLYRIGLII